MEAPTIFNDTEETIIAFAKHMAQEIDGFPGACKRCGITEAKGAELQTHPFFLKHYERELLRFNSPESTAERMQRMIDETVIFSLPEAVRLIHDPDASDNAKVGMMGNLLKHSSLGSTAGRAGVGGGGETVKITINLGDQTLKFEKEAPAIVLEDAKIEAVT